MICRLPLIRCLDTSERFGPTPGSVTVTVTPGPVTGVLAAARLSASSRSSSRWPAASSARARRCTSSNSVESALRRGALWDEVKDRLKTNAFGMSGGQQQRLCIARALATEPDVLLMDEPCSALDPISTGRIEDLMLELKESYSIVIVTHNMQQAARVSDMTAFFTVQLSDNEQRTGHVVEYAATDKIFTNPDDPRTEEYVTGKVG